VIAVGAELGFDRNVSFGMAYYLDKEGLLEWAGGNFVGLTSAGINEVERAITDP